MADDVTNLEKWLGWTREKAEKGKWYVKGETAVKDIAERMEEDVRERAFAKLQELKKLCLEAQGEEGRIKAADAVEKGMAEAEKLIEKNDLAGAQKRIMLVREKAAESLLLEDYVDALKELYRSVIRTAFDHPGFKKVQELAGKAFVKGWRLTQEEREELARTLKELYDDGSFKPPSEAVKLLTLIEEGMNVSDWI